MKQLLWSIFFSGISIIIRSAVIKDVGHKNNESEVFKKYQTKLSNLFGYRQLICTNQIEIVPISRSRNVLSAWKERAVLHMNVIFNLKTNTD